MRSSEEVLDDQILSCQSTDQCRRSFGAAGKLGEVCIEVLFLSLQVVLEGAGEQEGGAELGVGGVV